MTFSICHAPSCLCQSQIEALRSFSETTTPDKSICLRRIMRRAHLENHLVLLAKIKRLNVAPLAQIPNMQLMTVSALQEFFGNDAVLDLVAACPIRWSTGCPE